MPSLFSGNVTPKDRVDYPDTALKREAKGPNKSPEAAPKSLLLWSLSESASYRCIRRLHKGSETRSFYPIFLPYDPLPPYRLFCLAFISKIALIHYPD